jgi:diaminohydroxyphosphoribosylaminopyrimidine deaminase/5-amino-6-(5-phosphoribosylamino)uracil reductase
MKTNLRPPSGDDEKYMRQTIALSRRYWGLSSPNPAVGALVVKDGRILARGVHKKAGQLHGEALALAKAGPSARGATLYVNLEPCNHLGRTPPCTRAILQAGIARVVFGAFDPNPKAGGGGAFLASQGVEVCGGVLAQECEFVHRFFLTSIRCARPYIIMKGAVSLDGRIATSSGQSQWITSPGSRQEGHKLRGRVDAIMVGLGTVLADDPSLTCRLPGKISRQPLRVVVDTNLGIPLTARLLEPPGSFLLACGEQADPEKMAALTARGGRVWPLPADAFGKVSLPHLFLRLKEEQITSLMVEGGAELNFSLIREELVDELWLFMAPLLIGGRQAPALVGGEGFAALQDALNFKKLTTRRMGPDLLVRAWR